MMAAILKPNIMTQSLPPKPEPPEDWACCGSECGDACVHEIYRREKAEYENVLAALLIQTTET